MSRKVIIVLLAFPVSCAGIGIGMFFSTVASLSNFVLIGLLTLITLLLSTTILDFIRSLNIKLKSRREHIHIGVFTFYPFLYIDFKGTRRLLINPTLTMMNRTTRASEGKYRLPNLKRVFFKVVCLSLTIMFSIWMRWSVLTICLGLILYNYSFYLNCLFSANFEREKFLDCLFEKNNSELEQQTVSYLRKRIKSKELDYEDLSMFNYTSILKYDSEFISEAILPEELALVVIAKNNIVMTTGFLDLLFSRIYFCFKQEKIEECRNLRLLMIQVVNDTEYVLTSYLKRNYRLIIEMNDLELLEFRGIFRFFVDITMASFRDFSRK